MSKRKIVVFIGIGILVAVMMFFIGFRFGLSQCSPEKVVIKKPAAKKISSKKVAQALAPVPAPAPVLAPAPAPVLPPVIPAATPETRLILRLNIVEWSEIFEGGSLMSRDIGFIIRKGLSEGTVVRAKSPLMFNVNGAAVMVQNGQTVLDPGQIGPETIIMVRPMEGDVKFASPPNGLPLVTEPGELDSLVKKGVRELWFNFILAPPPR